MQPQGTVLKAGLVYTLALLGPTGWPSSQASFFGDIHFLTKTGAVGSLVLVGGVDIGTEFTHFLE